MMPNRRFLSGPRRTLWTAVLTTSLVLGIVAPAAGQTVDEHYAAGVAAFAAGDYPKTVTEMNASLAAKPNAKAALYLGNAYLKLGLLGAAKEALERALVLDPANPKRNAIRTLIKGIEDRDSARVTITSTPPGATIYLGSEQAGVARGKAPSELVLTPGAYELTVALEGYEAETKPQALKSGDRVTLDFVLRAKGCDVSLSAGTFGARASLDGAEPVPVPTQARVAVGEHTVTFTATGFESKVVPFACDGTKPVALEAKLVAVVPVGRVKVPPSPDTVIAIDGRVLSAEETALGVTLTVGRHEITFTVGNKPPLTKVVFVAANAEVAVEAPTDTPAPPQPAKPPPPPPRVGFPARGIYGGVVGGGNLTLVEWNLGTDTKGAHPTSSATAGVRVGVQLFPRLAIEGEAQWVGLPNRLDDALGHGLTTDVNVLFHVLDGKWTPIVEAGAGSYEVLSSKLGKDADLRVHAGVGLRGMVHKRLYVRADVRDVITDGFDKSIGNNLELLLGVETYLWETK